MSRNVKIATFSLTAPSIDRKPKEKSVSDYIIGWLDGNIKQVLPDRPDLIVLPECVDRPAGMRPDEISEYYNSRGSHVLDFIRGVARDNSCYIAYPAVRNLEDGTRRNSCMMIDRNGEIIGIYDKNYVVVTETERYNILPGENIAVFDCDFGRVGAVICFDLNFEEIRKKYKAASPDLIIFPSMYNGGMVRSFFAYDTESYLVSSCGQGLPAEILTPLGDVAASTTNYYNYTVNTVNLDFAICHLDFNRQKLRAAKEKYGELFGLRDIGYLGVVEISSLSHDITVDEIVREFDIELADDYFKRSAEHRKRALSK